MLWSRAVMYPEWGTLLNVSQSGKHLIFSQGHVTKNQPIAVPVSRNITNIDIELNNNTAHRTHNNTVSWFIPLQSDSQTLTKLDEKTSKENPRSQYFYDSSSSSLLSTHVLITLFGSPSPNLVVLLHVTKLWGVGLVKLSYNIWKRYHYNIITIQEIRLYRLICKITTIVISLLNL